MTKEEVFSIVALARHENRIPDLFGANLYRANLYEADLCGANLRGADLRGADLYIANLYGANLCRTNLRGADLRGADLRGADLRGADLGDLYFQQIGPIGSRKDYLIATWKRNETLTIIIGCWTGTLEEFSNKVNEVYPSSKHGDDYRAVNEVYPSSKHGDDYRAVIVLLTALKANSEKER